MGTAPWITIIGLGEDGADGLPPASLRALEQAEVIIGPPRHLSLIPAGDATRIEWPVPFADGLALLTQYRGQDVVVLVSGDPFWFGAGRAISNAFPGEWSALPGLSTFTRVAAALGWPVEDTTCLGLHAAPLSRMRPHLAPGARLIVLLRDGAAVQELANDLAAQGWGDTVLHICEAMGGPREQIRRLSVSEISAQSFQHPVCAALEIAGDGPALPQSSGLPDDLFASDGVMTKRAMRALTLSALAPRAGEHLWDIGGGSGTIAIEWLLAHPRCTATTIEPRVDRADLIRQNALALGVDRLEVIEGSAPAVLQGLSVPDVVFIGGGLSTEMLATLVSLLPSGTRLVANAVTLESEALLTQAQAQHGGELLRIELSQAEPMGRKQGWKAAYPIVQWSVTL